MTLLTPTQIEQLIRNGSGDQKGRDHAPVAKIYTAGGSKWLLTELHPSVQNFAYGLCQLGLRTVLMGQVDLNEICRIARENWISLYNDPDFKAKYPISVYAEAARLDKQIREDEASLDRAAASLASQVTPL